MLSPVFTSSLGLYQALQHAAAHAPDTQYNGLLPACKLAEWRDALPGETPEFFELPMDTGWCGDHYRATLTHTPETAVPKIAMHGPVRDAIAPGKVSFAFMPEPGTRATFSVVATRCRLENMAEQVRKHWALYGGGPKPATDKPVKRAVTWPANIIKVWLAQIEDRDYAGAMLTAENIGARYYPGNKDSVFVLAAPVQVDGLPDGMCSVRRGDGRWVVADTRTGRAMESRGFGSRKAAEESAVAVWQGMNDDRRANALRVIAKYETADTAAARVAYCKACGIEDPAQPQEPAPEAPEAPEAAPMSDCMAKIVATAAEPAQALPEVATVASEPARYRFGVHLLTAATPTSAVGYRLYSAQYVCAGPGLTAADITGANAMLLEAATARGQRVVMQGFGNYEARAWCELDPASPVNNPPPPVAASENAPLPDAPGAIDTAYPPAGVDALPLSQSGPSAPQAAPPSGGSLKPPPAEAGVPPGVQMRQPDKPGGLPESVAVFVRQSDRWRAARAGLMLRRWRHWRSAAPPPVESAHIPPAEAGPGCTPWRAKDTMRWGLGVRPSSGGSLALRQVRARQGCGPPLAWPSSPRPTHQFT